MKKSIVFVTSGLEFNGDTLKTKSLGGSESAMIYMARELAKSGNEVTVYCECDKLGMYDGVDYRHCHTFMEDNKSQVDVCVVSRFTHFLAKPIDSKLNILWVHDIGIQDPEIAISRIDNIFCLSEFQRKKFETKYNLRTDYFWTTTNGFDSTLVPKRVPFEQKKNNYIYSSRYERGIIKLLEEIWPRIVDRNPNAVLNLCGYHNKNTLDTKDDYIIKYYDKANELIKSFDNIYHHGCLSKKEYYKLLSNCAYMVYPTDFPEISCISAIEAQACGCLVLTSNDFALTETVKSNTKIDIDNNYNDNYLSLLDKYIDDIYENEVGCAIEAIQVYEWSNVAKSWDVKLDDLFIERFTNNKDRILNQLIYYSDIVAATQLSKDEKYKKLLDKSILDNNIDNTYNPIIVARENSRIKEVVQIVKDSILELNYEIKILELGSHDGEVSRVILDNFHFFVKKLYAYDSCQKALDYFKDNFKSKYDQLEFIHDDVLNIEKYKDLDINFIFVGELLEHIPNTIDFLTKLISIINQKTIICFTTPAGPWDNAEKNKSAVEHMHHFELNDIKHIFKEVDLTIVRSKETMMGRRGEPLYHWIYYFVIGPDDIVPKFYAPNYMDKFIKTRPYKSISGSMIVKNEENNLARCIKSFYDIVDELIIVDTGSTDSTLEIAVKYTDKIYSYKWEEEDGLGDFSKARNYSLSKCSGDYVLWMDADEELINPQILVRNIFSDYYDSILVKQRSCIVYGDSSHHDDPYHDRLFKREGARFTGVVHEYVTYGNNWVSKALFQDISFLIHYGTINKPKRQDRIRGRYFDLIVKNYRKYPNRLMAQYYYMGLLATIIKETGDLSRLSEVIEIWNNKLIPSGDLWLLKKSLNFIQDMYFALHHNDITVFGRTLEIKEFVNELNDKIRLIASSDEEFNLFLKIISNQSLVEYKNHAQYRF